MFVFSTYLLMFLLNFQSRELVGCGIEFHIQRVPTRHTFDGPRYPKNKKYPKNVMMTSSSCFLGSGVHKKYLVWVLIGCGIKFHIQRAFPIKIWVKKRGHMLKIQTKKVVFLMIHIPKFILKKCSGPIQYFKFKEISLANTLWHGICFRVKRPILSWNFL